MTAILLAILLMLILGFVALGALGTLCLGELEALNGRRRPKPEQMRSVQFHSSVSYEDFVRGYRAFVGADLGG